MDHWLRLSALLLSILLCSGYYLALHVLGSRRNFSKHAFVYPWMVALTFCVASFARGINALFFLLSSSGLRNFRRISFSFFQKVRHSGWQLLSIYGKVLLPPLLVSRESTLLFRFTKTSRIVQFRQKPNRNRHYMIESFLIQFSLNSLFPTVVN